MALSERTRSKMFTTLGPIIGEEAIGEMLTYFPARDVEEPASKEFIRAESASLRSETAAGLADLRAEVATAMADLRAEMTTAMADLRAEMNAKIAETNAKIAETNAKLADLYGEMRGIKHLLAFNAAMMLAIATAIIAAIRL